MGYERNNAIVVSARFGDWIDKAHAEAVRVFNQEEETFSDPWEVVSEIITSPVNDVKTFLVAPDGSKEGWATSDLGDRRRAAFTDWLNAQRYEDMSSPIQWVEVQYGDDDRETVVVDDDDAALRGADGRAGEG